ncbi:MAG: hypothetical protein KGD73_13030 [Candidatus Lokiarchaeota archaeon]|nr:hypothetical protein [Candidatus Lokiarchaeota archaeon]
MDVGYDFLTPELMHAIFFQQKNVVVYPYLDIKHLRALELFTTGHSSIELDCTALNDIISILEHQAGSYSQSPPLFFVLNAGSNIIQSVKEIENVRYIINTNENVETFANGNQLLFYNKKNKKFVNPSIENSTELEFENEIFRQSQGDQDILQDLLMQIKGIATRIYKELVESGDVKRVQAILEEYESIFPRKFWSRILQFTQNFFKIVIPEEVTHSLLTSIPRVRSTKSSSSHRVNESDFSSEYEVILSTNRNIAQAFITSLHDYRSEHVNPANLEVVQLYDPRELYNYLRNHHWKDGISTEFIEQWVNFKDVLDTDEIELFFGLFSKLNVSTASLKLNEINQESKLISTQSISSPVINKQKPRKYSSPATYSPLPSIRNFVQFKEWILAQLDELERRR